jgi:hypothetical protein
MTKTIKVVNSLGNYKGQFIVVAAPDYGCCQCGNRLEPHFGGLCTWISPFPCPFILEVCESCQSAEFNALTSGGKDVRLVSPTAIRALLDDEDRILGFAQISRLGDGVFLEPYPTRGN